MTQAIKTSMAKSSRDFVEVVWPQIRRHLGGGRIIPVETVTDSAFAKELDVFGGVDMWQILEHGMRGIASRVQWRNPNWHGDYPFDTYTIRWTLYSGWPTERHKRIYALEHPEYGLVFPAVTIQAYLEQHGGPLLSAGIVYTRDLYEAVQQGEWQDRVAPDGNLFRIVPWARLIDMGYKFISVKPQEHVL